MDRLCMNLITLCIYVSKEVDICFCNCWNIPEDGPRAKTLLHYMLLLNTVI
jgi:hypothetical protein